jgi:hypothetical protein
LEFKNIILEEKLSNKIKNGHENFSWFRDFLLGFSKTMKFRELQLSLAREKVSMTIFEFIAQFYFQNYAFKLQEVFSEIEIRVFLEKRDLEVSKHFLF